ncbi:hypothetical protein ACPESR_08730 [Nocardia testacea]|uniref:hypothetical protein n=1 Tax=Nocardia testacea TaxID=248551 RepID=UPI003C2C635E
MPRTRRYGAPFVCRALLGDLGAEIEAATGRQALPWPSTREQAEALADTVYDVPGRCDALVDDAGTPPVYDNVSAVTEELYESCP